MGNPIALDTSRVAETFSIGAHMGFDIIRAENGAWVLSDFDPETGRSRRYVCKDGAELVLEIRAWSDRAVRNFEAAMGGEARGF